MKTLKTLSVVLLLLILPAAAFAQSATDSHTVTITIPTIALLAVSNTGVTLTITPPGADEEGLAPTGDSDNTTRLYYTSLVGATGHKITVQETGTDAIPGGVTLRLSAAPPTGIGDPGDTATPAGTTLSFADLKIAAASLITGIGSTYTGRTTDGAQITYELVFDTANFDLLDVADSGAEFTIEYTIITQ